MYAHLHNVQDDFNVNKNGLCATYPSVCVNECRRHHRNIFHQMKGLAWTRPEERQAGRQAGRMVGVGGDGDGGGLCRPSSTTPSEEP